MSFVVIYREIKCPLSLLMNHLMRDFAFFSSFRKVDVCFTYHSLSLLGADVVIIVALGR